MHRPARPMCHCRSALVAVAMTFLCLSASAATPVLQTQPLADGVYALIGPTSNRDPSNLGNNANFGVIVTNEGVILIDSGGSHLGAQMIHEAVKAITAQPIKLVINTGGQDHRWLGNSYFRALGARILANEKAVADQRARLSQQLARLQSTVGSAGLAGTEPAYADQTFSDQQTLEMGGVRLDLHHAGHAHTPGDSFVHLPQFDIVFSGDIVYLDRMLGIGPQSAHRSWIEAFEAIAAQKPQIVVPGHGKPGDLSKARAQTHDYLVFLRQAVQALIDEGKGMADVSQIDQSRFAYLANYEDLKGRNAQRVYEEIEWE